MEIAYIATKYYIEMFSKDGKSNIAQVSEKNPLLFNDEKASSFFTGFRFFNIRTVVISEEPGEEDKIVGQRENYSKMYYFGKRITLEEIKNMPMSSWLIPLMKKEKSNSVIFCECGSIITNPEEGSLTIEEYQRLNSKEEKSRVKEK